MKRLGKLDLARHFIGERKPIVAFIGISALSLSGCGTEEDKFTLFTQLSTCLDNSSAESCETSYQKAQLEALRTARKYQSERSCTDIYGNICFENEGVWQPTLAGFITHNNSDYVMPFFTSTNPDSRYFGYAFAADGFNLGQFNDVNGVNIDLPKEYTRPLPAGSLEQESSSAATNNTNEVARENNANRPAHNGSILRDLATAYVLSNAISGTGNYLSERERTKRYNECMNRGGSNCYNVSSGTARVGTSNSSSHTNKTSTTTNSSSKKASQTQSYKSAPTVSTVSKGGFGNTGSMRGGFGG